MSNILAIAKLTIKEALRKRVYVLLVIFTVILLLSLIFFPVLDPKAKLRLLQVWAFRMLFVFTVIIVVFIAGTSIPREVSTRTIYILASKPIGKGSIFLGKWLGFSIIVFLFIVACFIISNIFFRIVQVLSYPSPKLSCLPFIKSNVIYVEEVKSEKGEHKPQKFMIFDEKSSATFFFEDINVDTFGKDIKARLFMDTGSLRGNVIVFTSKVLLEIENVKTGKKMRKICKIDANEPEYVNLCSKEFARGGIRVKVKKGEIDKYLVITKDSVYLVPRHEIYESNMAKGAIMLFLLSLLGLSAVIAIASIVSAPVSIFFGITFFLVGLIYDFSHEATKTTEKRLEAIQKAREAGKHYHAKGEIPEPVVRISLFISKIVYRFIPDFQVYNFYTPLVDNLAIPLEKVKGAFLYTILRVVILLLAGFILINLRDFK
jgi:hypothetical protein